MSRSEKTNIGILGLGAIGSVLASLLIERPDHELYCYNRSPRSAIKIIGKNREIEIPVELNVPHKERPALDWLLVCLKEYHYEDAEQQFRDLIAPATKVAVIRNGLRLKQPLLKYTSPEYIIEGMIDCPVQPEENGFYRQFYKPIITLKKEALADDFTDLFSPADITVRQVDDFITASWNKLLESAAFGSILCLSGETKWVFRDNGLTALYRQLVKEGIAVAKADGAQLSESMIPEMVIKMKQYPGTKGSSMLTDRLEGRPIEIGAKNGIISKLGKKYRIKTPMNDVVCSLLKYTNTKPA